MYRYDMVPEDTAIDSVMLKHVCLDKGKHLVATRRQNDIMQMVTLIREFAHCPVMC